MILSDNFKEQSNHFLAKADSPRKRSTGWIYAVERYNGGIWRNGRHIRWCTVHRHKNVG